MAGRRALLAVLLAGTAIVGVDCRERNGTEVDHAGSGTAPAPERTNCEKCARASDQTSRESPCWYASPASNNVYVQHKFCSAQGAGSGTQFACCPVMANGLSYDCSQTFGRCACVGAGCPQRTTYAGRGGGEGPSLFSILIPILLIASVISCCVSYRRQQQAMYYQQEMAPMPPGYHPNAPGYGQQMGGYPPMAQPVYQQNQGMAQPVYQQNQGMGAGTAAALGVGGGLLGGMMLANAMDGGHHHHGGGGYGDGGAPQQEMGGGDIGADMGFGE
eukprot:Tamp_21080.p1 GENE.Tamp_21080~~Tamp_21080.p1  ORF type:complete len:274 (+),score=29.68 Tamp_21080:1-822(+)